MVKKGRRSIKIPVRRTSAKSKALDEDNVEETVNLDTECEDISDMWREKALRLKADMVNYRKRQERWASDEVQREKDRLLMGFVDVLDNLEQVVFHLDPENVTHQGVMIAYNQMVQLIAQEGLERIDVQNAPFDPQWHEAIAMTPALKSQVETLRIKEVVNHGYRIGDRVLKPSRVVVSKRMD